MNRIKKNILDLRYQKNLSYFNTAVIILFTYVIGVMVALLIGRISFVNYFQLGTLVFVTVGFFGVNLWFMKEFKKEMNLVLVELKAARH